MCHSFKLIIELYGYQFHQSKESFENDRKRDRLLRNRGYYILRFSGAEIHKDPVETSIELMKYLDEEMPKEVVARISSRRGFF